MFGYCMNFSEDDCQNRKNSEMVLAEKAICCVDFHLKKYYLAYFTRFTHANFKMLW